jgi:2-keto-4-pentenoate hydratase/2-oxohepta-3-ene-1,7-dioic acid hydratase in catechol pathway
MKTFAYYTTQNIPRIGIEFENGRYDFTQIWEFFKDFKGFSHVPSLQFLQVMVEMDYFSNETLVEVVEIVRDFRSFQDIRVPETIHVDVPISRPQKILCLGRNYRDHAKEMDSEVPQEPIFFAKLPSALLAHEKQIRIPKGIGRVDHEIELAVIIGKQTSRIAVNRAMDQVAGYTIANDVTAREIQKECKQKGLPWTLSKGLDSFCPMGPYLVPADIVKDPHNLNIELRVNGKIKQSANTRDMIFKIPEIIAFISRYITLSPGDIICTGTPAGVSPLQNGDDVEVEIEGLGTLANQVGVV